MTGSCNAWSILAQQTQSPGDIGWCHYLTSNDCSNVPVKCKNYFPDPPPSTPPEPEDDEDKPKPKDQGSSLTPLTVLVLLIVLALLAMRISPIWGEYLFNHLLDNRRGLCYAVGVRNKICDISLNLLNPNDQCGIVTISDHHVVQSKHAVCKGLHYPSA